MRGNNWKLLFGAMAVLSLSACASEIQTTSGRDYLSKYSTPADTPVPPSVSEKPGAHAETIDEKVRRIAAVEPILRFPARIGLARIVNGDLTNIPADEAKAWYGEAEKLGKDFGQFIPLNRLVAEMVTNHSNRSCGRDCFESDANTRLHRVMEKIRLGAARQHLDAVLVYEVYGKSEGNWNPLAMLDFTVVGGFILPGESIEAEGFASALLVDVRNGYPYGTARKVVKKSSLSPSFLSGQQERKTRRSAATQAAIELASETGDMFRKLKSGLAKRVSGASVAASGGAASPIPPRQ